MVRRHPRKKDMVYCMDLDRILVGKASGLFWKIEQILDPISLVDRNERDLLVRALKENP